MNCCVSGSRLAAGLQRCLNMSSGACREGASSGTSGDGWTATDACRQSWEPRGGRQPCGWGSARGLPCPSLSFGQLAHVASSPQTLQQGAPGEQRRLQPPTPSPEQGLALQLRKLAARCSGPRGTGPAPGGLLGESQKEKEPLGNCDHFSVH